MIRQAVGALVIGALVLGAVLVWQFAARLGPVAVTAPLAPVAVVFTGQFDRVELGLALLERRVIDRLFISGVNRGAGIRPQGFAHQFALSPTATAALATGRIILAPEADTTFENALETRCWLMQQPDIAAVVLITGRFHMPRAATVLERALPRPVVVHRLSPAPPEMAGRHWPIREFAKFAATWAVTLLPLPLWPGRIPPGCP